MSERIFYFADGNEKKGPFTIAELAGFGIGGDTMVWYPGLSAWQKAKDAPLTAVLFIPMPSEPSPANVPPPFQPAKEAENTVNEETSRPRNEHRRDESPRRDEPCPSDNIAWAIMGLILFFPCGIPALVYSLRVSSLWMEGRYEEARMASDSARTWGKVAVIVGACGFALFFIVMLFYFASLSFLFSNL